jgi:hypothetical protein
MFKKYILIFFVCCIQVIYASENIHVVYNAYKYEMSKSQFTQFLKDNNLNTQQATPSDETNIIYKSMIPALNFIKLNQKLIFQSPDFMSGNTQCKINNGVCQFENTNQLENQKLISSKISIKPSMAKDKTVFATVRGDFSNPNLKESINFTTSLTNITDNSFLIITQYSKNKLLYGQIILVFFSIF